jgi:radical SAM protein with 4Fe4S-binding SPASM domain
MGAKFPAFFDVLNGDFYQYQPGTDIDEVRRELKEAGLIFETEAIVPFKTVLNVLDIEKDLVLRTLQIRLNGCEEDNCWNRRKLGPPKKKMDAHTAEKIVENFQHLPIDRLVVEAETFDKEIVITLLKGLHPEQIHLVLEHGIAADEVELLKRTVKTDVQVVTQRNVPIREIITDAFDFFYHQSFNPCLGHQVAIDTQGEIKPCLWWPGELGHIHKDTVRDMIYEERFKQYWEANKDSIEVCKDCEYRYNCHDCRLNSLNPDEILRLKPVFCCYDPYNGKGNKETVDAD